MKKLFKGLITLLFGLMLAGLVWGFFNTLQQWPTWTVWNSVNYPEMSMNYEGEPSGPGSIQRWDDGHTQGTIRITDTEPNRSVRYQLSMDEDSIQMQGEFLLQSRGDATEVQWRLSGDSGANPIARLMMYAYKPIIKVDLETNLRQLRDKLSNPQTKDTH